MHLESPGAGAFVSLESGDHLTQAEFHRHYTLRPDIHRAELVEGVVWVGGRVTVYHAAASAAVAGWLGYYLAVRPGPHAGIRITTILDDCNEVQPDSVLWWPRPGGPDVNDDGYVVGAPQLVFEVSGSSVSYDLHQKKEAYRRNGIREYIVWRIRDRAIDWFELQHGVYILRGPDTNGIIESATFPGLRLHVACMLAYDRACLISHLSAPA